MVVSPRYAEYEDTADTGTCVPVLLPHATSSQQHPGQGSPPADSSSALPSSQTAANSAPTLEAETATASQEEQHPPRATDTNFESSPEHPAASLQQTQDTAQYYLCRKAGVDFVFVDHPVYCRASDIYGSSNVNTYQEAGDFPDLDLRYSVLCQAALVAPLLLWHASSVAGQGQEGLAFAQASQQSQQQQQHMLKRQVQAAAGSEEPHQALSGMSQLQAQLPDAVQLMPAGDRPAAMPAVAAAPLHAAVGNLDSTPVSPVQAATAASSVSSAAAADPLQASTHHAQGTSPVAPSGAAALNVSAPSAVPGHAPSRGGEGANHSSSSGQLPGKSKPTTENRAALVFVSNDWPCAPLALRLKHSLQCMQPPAASSLEGGPLHDFSSGSLSSGEAVLL